MYLLESIVAGLDQLVHFGGGQVLSVARVRRSGHWREIQSASFEQRQPVVTGTFVEMLLELVEATLLQANFQVDPVASGGRSQSRPLPGDIVGVLDGVGVTRVKGRAECSSVEDCEQDGRNGDLHLDVSTGSSWQRLVIRKRGKEERREEVPSRCYVRVNSVHPLSLDLIHLCPTDHSQSTGGIISI